MSDMKYGLFWSYSNSNRDENEVDLKHLPEKCCAKCAHWIDTSDDRTCRWACCAHHSDYDYEYFSFADDICDCFEPDEEDPGGEGMIESPEDIEKSCGEVRNAIKIELGPQQQTLAHQDESGAWVLNGPPL